jgi:lipoate---protein ligase
MTPETPDTVILVSPANPYVCVGFHQELEKEVDLEFCRGNHLPVYRREVGGGAVYLDEGQVFTQWIFHPSRLPADLDSRFKLFAEPLVDTYRAIGIDAYYRPINDIHVGGKKIGGTGAARMGNADVVVGSMMFTFDKKIMARVLKVPSEKMRDKIVESLEQYMTTMAEMLGALPDRKFVKDLYAAKCAQALNAELVPGVWTDVEEVMAAEWDARFLAHEWLYQRGGLKQVGVKIHEDVRVVESDFKAPGGLIRLTARLSDGRIDDVTLSGDFTLFPSFSLGALETAVRGLRANEVEVVERLEEVYHALKIQSPGVAPTDFGRAFGCAIEAGQQSSGVNNLDQQV